MVFKKMRWIHASERNRRRSALLSRRSFPGGGAKKRTQVPLVAGAEDASPSKVNVESEDGNGIASPVPRTVAPPSFRHNDRKLFLDSRTVRTIRAEVDDLPLPATLSSVCLALRISDSVLEAHADADPSRLTDDGRMKSLEIVGTYLSEMSLSLSPEKRRDRRKEDFRAACLLLASGGNGTMMKSWEEVERGLTNAFLFAKFNDAREELTPVENSLRSSSSSAIASSRIIRRSRDHRSPPQKPTPKRAHCSSPKKDHLLITTPSSVVVSTPSARGSFLSIELFREQIKKKMGREKFLRVFRQGEILQSRPSLPSHDETASRLDELIKRGEMELPSKKRADEIIVEKEREDREREAMESAMKLMRPLTAEERSVVIEATEGVGPPAEILASQDADSVQRGSMQTLRPGQWLNDEVINYFLKNCLARRDEMLCAKEPGRRRSHFFNSFFVQTMFDEKNNDPKLRGKYNYKNVRRWAKKVPGKDIFNLKYILCPINLDNMHWTSAVIFMEEKKIQYYDSMGGTDRTKLEGLLEYVKDEYRAKNGKEMDVTDWKLVSCTRDTPRQRNGFDCGVFTCMFCDFISKDCALVFNQDHIDQCRDRIALSIMKNCAIE
ncbi:hypothetical protein ACHAXA_000506 [Cyclostephanos tholiformis]|uniref:Ubiquitin-like protease family profile domain-containing protein n=1 Tax=Cyclostephanos tholiformis TaxID=382380 RepID=A0ABD3ST44_9STRA